MEDVYCQRKHTMNNKEIIAALNKLDLSSYHYDAVKELVSQFQPKILRITIPAGAFIERIRPGVGFYERKDVTYRPSNQNTKPQRATLPGKTAFYGTICHIDEPLSNMRAIALFEASKLCKGDKNVNGTEQYTLSRWRANDELKLAVFAHESVYPDAVNNKLLAAAKEELVSKKTFLDEVFCFDEYIKYVTQEFAKPVYPLNDYDYIVSATIAEMLMYASRLDGVLYPSVPSKGMYGMNVALREDIADTKLILEDVREMEYIQNNGKGSLKFISSSVVKTIDDHGYKTWEYIPYETGVLG